MTDSLQTFGETQLQILPGYSPKKMEGSRNTLASKMLVQKSVTFLSSVFQKEWLIKFKCVVSLFVCFFTFVTLIYD